MNSKVIVWVNPKIQWIAWKNINKRQIDLFGVCLGGLIGSKEDW